MTRTPTNKTIGHEALEAYRYITSHNMEATPLGYIVVMAVDNADARLNLSNREMGIVNAKRIKVVAEEFRKECVPLFNKLCPILLAKYGYMNISVVAASELISKELGLGNAGEVAFPALVGIMGQLLVNHCLKSHPCAGKENKMESR